MSRLLTTCQTSKPGCFPFPVFSFISLKKMENFDVDECFEVAMKAVKEGGEVSIVNCDHYVVK